MKTVQRISCTALLFFVLNCVATGTTLFAAVTPYQEVDTTSIQGQVVLPEDVPAGINVEGLSIDDVFIVLEGHYKHPRKPYPDNWREMAPKARGKWLLDFKNSEANEEYERKVKKARAQRPTFTTEIKKDGSFVFENIKPMWYQLRVLIMPPNAPGEPSHRLARGHALRQFIIKDAQKPYNLGTITLKVKNVLLPGDMAPDWAATAYDDTEFKLSDFRGQYVLVDVWATWCLPCKAEIPNLEEVYEDFGGERFEMIGLNIDATIDLPKAFHKEKPSAYRHGFLGHGKRHEQLSKSYGINSIPSIWLIGPDGKIIARGLHGKEIREAVSSALESSTEQ